MKNTKITTIILLLIFAFLFYTGTFKSDSIIVANISEKIGVSSQNLLANSDFHEDFKGWSHTDNTKIVETNGVKILQIRGKNDAQMRAWQNLNVVSGQTYRLFFSLTGPEKGAFAICRDMQLCKEQYKYCKGKNNNSKYIWDFKPLSTGNCAIYLSTFKEGTYYYSKISLRKINVFLNRIYLILAIIFCIISFFLLLIVLSKFYNTIFVVITLFFITVPLVKISKETKSEMENRNLYDYKPLVCCSDERIVINTDYGIDFNNWINDHFFCRKWLVSKNTELDFFLNRKIENKLAFQGKEGWLFFKHNYHDGNCKETSLKIKNQIDTLSECFFKKGINIYFAVMPEKECLYSEKHYVRKFDKEKIPECLANICTNNFIYLKNGIDILKKEGYTHFKEDHHWTHLGAYGGYMNLMRFINRDINLSTLSKDDFVIEEFLGVYDEKVKNKIGSAYHCLGLTDKAYKFINKYYVFHPRQKSEFVKAEERYALYKGGLNNIKVMIIGDSNIGFLIPFITSSFSDSLLLYAAGLPGKENDWAINDYDEIINDFQPRIIIVVVRALNVFKWLELKK